MLNDRHCVSKNIYLNSGFLMGRITVCLSVHWSIYRGFFADLQLVEQCAAARKSDARDRVYNPLEEHTEERMLRRSERGPLYLPLRAIHTRQCRYIMAFRYFLEYSTLTQAARRRESIDIRPLCYCWGGARDSQSSSNIIRQIVLSLSGLFSSTTAFFAYT